MAPGFHFMIVVTCWNFLVLAFLVVPFGRVIADVLVIYSGRPYCRHDANPMREVLENNWYYIIQPLRDAGEQVHVVSYLGLPGNKSADGIEICKSEIDRFNWTRPPVFDDTRLGLNTTHTGIKGDMRRYNALEHYCGSGDQSPKGPAFDVYSYRFILVLRPDMMFKQKITVIPRNNTQACGTSLA